MDAAWVPLAERSSVELQAKADELRRMAQGATTQDVMTALLNLASRYAALAARRRAEED